MSEGSVPVDMATPELPAALAGARAALTKHDWTGAFDGFTLAEAQTPLVGADLEALAQAAFFTGNGDAQLEAEERAFHAHLAAGDADRAAYMAIDLAQSNYFKGKPSIATAWFRRAEKLLDGKPESYAQGYLELARSFLARSSGDIETALASAEKAIAIGFRATDADLQATGQIALGGLKISTGSTAEGLEIMEEATIAAVSGELSPMTTGITYCAMISACRDLTDYKRASEWTEATERWCERQSVSGFPGVCRIHRAEVIALGGAWERADTELRKATAELATFNAVPPMADGFYAIGELRLRMGDLDQAEEALRQAHSLGRSPQPALARVRLAQGNIGAASKAIASAVAEGSWDLLAKTRLLPAQAEIALAARNLTTAREAAEELDEITKAYEAPAIQATRRETWGRVYLAEDDASAAARELRAAIALWREVAAPYEVARDRALLADALRMLDDDDAADLELEAARDEFVRLGARLDAEATTATLKALADRRAGPQHVHRTFMFTDIEGSTKLAETLGDAAWDALLRWHDDAIRAQVRKAGGELVNSTGDGFFVAFDAARPAVTCAIAIQQVLAEHRRSSGFALSVRIGLHSAEASQRVDDYSGIGVHLASRVAALGAGGEIVATADTLEEAGEVATEAPREAMLRGVSAPVSVATVSWS